MWNENDIQMKMKFSETEKFREIQSNFWSATFLLSEKAAEQTAHDMKLVNVRKTTLSSHLFDA